VKQIIAICGSFSSLANLLEDKPMYRNFPHARQETTRPPMDRGIVVQFRPLDEARWLAVARQRRADHMRALVATLLGWRVKTRVLLISVVVALASVALVTSYAAVLSREGVPASALALSAVLFASTISSIAGFAFSAVGGAILLQMMSDPIQVVEVLMVSSIAIQSLSVAMLWRDIDWAVLVPFLIGGAIGLPFGVWFLLHIGHIWFKEAVGGLLIAYAAYALLNRPVSVVPQSGLTDATVGFLGGITGGLAGFPGATVTIWCGLKGWDKQRQRGVYQPFILIMQILALLLIQSMQSSGRLGDSLSLYPLQFIPVALLGTWFGLAIFKRMSDQFFAMAVKLLLLVSGVGLLV
jgi:uncharacterized membrane protein YfcA